MDKKQGFMIVWNTGEIAGISGTLRQVRKAAQNLHGTFHVEDSQGNKVFRKDARLENELTNGHGRVKVGPATQNSVRDNEAYKPPRRKASKTYASKKRRENEKAGPCVTLAAVWPR